MTVTSRRDFTFVGTVTRVITDAVRRRVTHPGPVNLAFGSRVTLLEVVTELEEILGRTLPVEHHDPRPGDVAHSQADDTRLHCLFPDVAPVSLREGLEATVSWFEASR